MQRIEDALERSGSVHLRAARTSPRARSVFLVTHATTIRNVPDAILLDFGGVIFQTAKNAGGSRAVAVKHAARMDRAGIGVTPERLEAALRAGLVALKHWKHAQSRRLAPTELAPREIVGDFLASDLPAAARELLIAEAGDLLRDLTRMLSSHALRPGIPELLDFADDRGIPVGIVSNAHSGRSHREVLAEHGLEGRFAVQCYSDEVGLRKPHPGIIALAAEACGAIPERCWYVGDTQDRDVVAGRRAGVGAVILTRSHHTDDPPFAVTDRADAVYDTPEGVVTALREASGSSAPLAEPGPDRGGPALLIDHGGVISQSERDPHAIRAFAGWLAALLSPDGEARVSAEEVESLVASARIRHSEFKRRVRRRDSAVDASRIPEVEPVEFWRDWFGASLSPRQRAVLAAEAHDIMARYGLAKSKRRLRDGIRELLEACRAEGIPVVVVSNTISGRSVRAACRDHGIDEFIAAYECSDEVGTRKPAAALTDRALTIAGADPARAVFLGDKPENDAVSARRAGITCRVLVRGGSTADADLDAAAADGLATHVVSDPRDVIALLTTAVPAL